MFAEAGAWFWTHVVVAILIVIGDYNGTLEPALNKFEESIGIRTILPERLQLKKDTTNANVPPLRKL